MITAVIVTICSIACPTECEEVVVRLTMPTIICPMIVPPSELLPAGKRIAEWRCIMEDKS